MQQSKKEGAVSNSLTDKIMALKIGEGEELDFATDKILLHIPIKRPNRQDFIRVHENPNYCSKYALLEVKEDNEIFLLDTEVSKLLPDEFFFAWLHLAITRQNNIFFWPVKTPKPGGKTVAWHSSALQCAKEAKSNWVRVVANRDLACYEMIKASADLPEPVWPETDFNELLEIAFKDRIITSRDHHVVKRLLGEL